MTVEYYYDIEQGSDDWHALRCGIITASEMKKILTPTLKVADNDRTRQHVYEIAAQRITKYVEPSYISDDMLRGMSDEIKAVLLYSEKYTPVKGCGFITNDFLGCKIGYSPDGLVGENGLIEVKSRVQKYQIETISKDEVPIEYMLQLQTGLMVTGRDYIDFISYCGGMPMFVRRVEPMSEYENAIEEAVLAFEAKVNSVIESFKDNASRFHMTEREEELDII